MDNNLNKEAEAFDQQIVERVANGHIPDLRKTQICEYFYNNPWRHSEYVKLDMGEQFEKINNAIKNYLNQHNSTIKVLEVGCGPGYLSLELSRSGYDVVGIDISQECIKIAEMTANNDAWKKDRGNLKYVVGDFLICNEIEEKQFDVVVFLGSLHHFGNLQEIMDRVNKLLKNNGIVITHEPTRDRISEGNLVFIHLIQVLLSINGGFYKKIDIPTDMNKHQDEIKKLLLSLKYETENGENIQSVHDNESGFSDMYSALSNNFSELQLNDRYAFFHELIGGLRYDWDTNILLAKYLRDVDAQLCKLGVLQSTEFFYVGRKKN